MSKYNIPSGQIPKPVKERDNLDLLQLALELHARTLNFPSNKELHDAAVEAKQELQSRLQPSGPEGPVDEIAIQKLGDNILTEMKKNPNHICTLLNKDEIISYNTGFHTGFRAGFLATSPKGKEEEILNFIYLIRESFIGADKVYTLGSCYQFYRILKFIFPNANAYYNSDHVITEINGKYYDITDEVEKTNHLLMDEHYPENRVMQTRYNIAEPTTPQPKDTSGMQWISGHKKELLPPDDSNEDFQKLYVCRFKGDDPRSGWVDIKLYAAYVMREIDYSDYWEWLDESDPLLSTQQGERMFTLDDMRECFLDAVGKVEQWKNYDEKNYFKKKFNIDI